MRLAHFAWRPHPLVLAIAATLGAAALVFYLQHRSITALQSQTEVIVKQVSEQAAVDIATELRRTLDGPIFDTLTAVNHPELRAGRLDLVSEQFARGLRTYPHVDRFVAWSAQTQESTPDEVLFYGRDQRFIRDAALGREVFALARKHAPTQHIYIAAESVGPSRQQVFLRVFWNDAERREYFAVLGFVVDPVAMPRALFAGSKSDQFRALLSRRAGDVALQLRVLDDHGNTVFGSPSPGALAGRVEFPMLFYPADDIGPRMAAGVMPRPWVIEVGADDTGVMGRLGNGYWPTALSVMLMLVALGLTVQAHRRSSELAQMQTDFVSHVSHQLKTPLSLLSTATETLQMDRIRSPEKMVEYLDTIRAEATRLTALVQRVLEFSRLQQQRTYEFETVDVATLVRETVEAFALALPHSRFVFEADDRDRGPWVLADPVALEQVVTNLLDNAVKYSPRTQPIGIRVGATRRTAIIEVTDAGIGIAPAERERIFERFYRAPGAPSRQGFGLGLTIVRELVRAHHGEIEVLSNVGAGSTFRIVLPRTSPDLTIAPPMRTRQPETAA
jgi:signal transduction histidine kinase